jgi:hypothetical protein
VCFDALTVAKHVCSEELAAEEVVDDQGGDVALTAAGILRRPVVLLVGGVQAPGLTNRLFEFGERE